MADAMNGKTTMVTGATAGIGKQTALELAKQGARLVIVGRNADKTRGVVKELKAQSNNTNIEFFVADLSSLASIRQLAKDFLAKHARLDVLVNNAGAMNVSRELTVDGHERTFATNHLAYFLLTKLLMPALEAAAPSRIVNVSSDAHRAGPLDFDDLMAEKSYGSFRQYGRSKLANILFTIELAKRVREKGITVNALHPGFVASEFLSKGGAWKLLKPIAYLFAADIRTGAQTSVYLASSPKVDGVTGKYFAKCREKATRTYAKDEVAAKRLWDESEKLVAA